ncbi:MAG: type II toxin-antitoxin system VapC family toxin [Cuniculiplasma sp.]
MNGIRVCVDTNVFLNVLNKETPYYKDSREVLLAIESGILEGIIPTLVISEVLTGFYIDKREKDASGFLSAILTNENFRVVPLCLDIAVSSAIIRANTRLKLPDAMVLATAVQLHADFLVSNDVGFPDVYKNVRHVGSKEMSERPK